jgi:hypothetical protein
MTGWLIAGAAAVVLVVGLVLALRRAGRTPPPAAAPLGGERDLEPCDLLPDGGREAAPYALSAEEALRRVRELQKSGALWPEILQALNPEGDSRAQQWLLDLRGPHLFRPDVALNVLEIGCRRALERDARADGRAALKEALRETGKIVGD